MSPKKTAHKSAERPQDELRTTTSTTKGKRGPVDLGQALIEAFLTNERINQVLLEILDPHVWRATPPCSQRRNIATSFAHIHNVRCMRLKMSSSTILPSPLDRTTVTVSDAKSALEKSAIAMVALIASGLTAGGRVRNHRPDVVSFVCAAITHEASHRGQVCHWSRELGFPITIEQQLKLWEWDKRWKEVTGR